MPQTSNNATRMTLSPPEYQSNSVIMYSPACSTSTDQSVQCSHCQISN